MEIGIFWETPRVSSLRTCRQRPFTRSTCRRITPWADCETSISKDDFHLIGKRIVRREFRDQPLASRIVQHFGATAQVDSRPSGWRSSSSSTAYTPPSPAATIRRSASRFRSEEPLSSSPTAMKRMPGSSAFSASGSAEARRSSEYQEPRLPTARAGLIHRRPPAVRQRLANSSDSIQQRRQHCASSGRRYCPVQMAPPTPPLLIEANGMACLRRFDSLADRTVIDQ